MTDVNAQVKLCQMFIFCSCPVPQYCTKFGPFLQKPATLFLAVGIWGIPFWASLSCYPSCSTLLVLCRHPFMELLPLLLARSLPSVVEWGPCCVALMCVVAQLRVVSPSAYLSSLLGLGRSVGSNPVCSGVPRGLLGGSPCSPGLFQVFSLG